MHGPVAALASPAAVVHASAAWTPFHVVADLGAGGADAADKTGLGVVEREDVLSDDGRHLGGVGGEVEFDQQRERAPGDGLGHVVHKQFLGRAQHGGEILAYVLVDEGRDAVRVGGHPFAKEHDAAIRRQDRAAFLLAVAEDQQSRFRK